MFEDLKDEFVNKKDNGRPTIRNHTSTALAEYFGTALLVFLSCMGSCLGIQGNISSMHSSLTAGLAVTIAIQTFGHISGAHINPAVSISALIVKQIEWIQLPLYGIAQLLGSLSGAGLFAAVTNNDLIPDGMGQSCVNKINENISIYQGILTEFLLSLIMNLAICSSWDPRNNDKQDSVPLKIGLLVAALNFAGGVYTGASMNPARSFGPAVVSNNFANHWVYWLGPTLGAVTAAIIYRVFFTRNKDNS
ncbi:aquaporin AQPAe.a-like [Anthonomus grandis grandis]|uniref:aquaporin AQPAe.a-like n=1 Tax=Anthonomus grandis grandis TaxID=2921223 RepID=UPI0021668C51|nr:aquaporin AQPAe.a-like [Anthonomus grandis grandis]